MVVEDAVVVSVVEEVVDSTGIPGTMMVLVMKTDLAEATDPLKKEMEQDAVGLLVDTVVVVVVAVEASAMESQVTLNAHGETLNATVGQVTGKQQAS